MAAIGNSPFPYQTAEVWSSVTVSGEDERRKRQEAAAFKRQRETMTAGMIRVPTIVPLRPPSHSRKNMIDTRTPIEVSSETPGALIYYTINGTKPDPFKKLGEKFTYRYYKPFLLGAGKRTVKAMATSSDGTRESSIVTKMFLVEEAAELRDDSEDDMEEDGHLSPRQPTAKDHSGLSHPMRNLGLSQSQITEQSQNGWTSQANQGKKSEALVNSSLSHRKAKGETTSETRFGQREDVRSPQYLGLLLDRSPENMFHENRTPREMELTKCIYCFAPRPSDPYSTFCNDCGSPLPQLANARLSPPHADKLGMCKVCHSMVPLHAPTCVICEAAMTPQRLPQRSPRLPDKIVCDLCDTINPLDMTRCVACESKLPLKSKEMPSGVSAPPLPKDDESLITCSNCFRVNSGDARFCDWCASKPVPYTSYLTCSRCNGNNQPYSKYCSSCACHIDPPPRVNSSRQANGVLGTLVEKEKVPKKLSSGKLPTWIPVDVPRISVDTANQATQTGGLFYPSGTTINKQQKLEAGQRARTDNLRDRRPTLTAVSPGRGYWRQQMDHICSHLRAHAQNNPDFRAMIGEPRIGKLVSTTLHEDFDGEELTLTVTFTQRETDNSQSKSKLSGKDVFKNIRTGSKHDLGESSSSIGSSGNPIKKKTPKKSSKKKIAVNKLKENILSKETRLLFKELGKSGEGSPEEVERLISEEADVNGENADGVRILTVAVHSNHVDCIPLLVNHGAELNHQSATKGNTALHEAVLQGPSSRQCVEVLLGCGADTMQTNKAGESAYDLAVKSGNENIIEMFTTNLGQGLLEKLTKLKSGS